MAWVNDALLDVLLLDWDIICVVADEDFLLLLAFELELKEDFDEDNDADMEDEEKEEEDGNNDMMLSMKLLFCIDVCWVLDVDLPDVDVLDEDLDDHVNAVICAFDV